MINFNKKDPIADAVKDILQQEALKGNQGNIDKNHNNRIDKEDFKILRGEKKEVKKEEVEQIDELSKGTLGSYVKGAARDMAASRGLAKDFERDAKSAKKPNTKDINTRLSNKFMNHASKRNAGIGKAVERLTKEEIEPLDEISSGLATSYLNKRTAQHKPNLNSPETSNRDAKVAKGISSASRREHGFGPDKSAANKVTGRFEYRKNVGATHTFNKEENEETKVMSKSLKQFREGWDDMLKAVKERNKPQPNGGSGVKQGSRYGGSKQKDEPEKDTDEKK